MQKPKGKNMTNTGVSCQHIEAETKWPQIPENVSKCIFFNENVWISIKISLRFVPKGSISNIFSIGLYNGLAPVRRQAIIWTNDGLVYWRTYAPLGLSELKELM